MRISIQPLDYDAWNVLGDDKRIGRIWLWGFPREWLAYEIWDEDNRGKGYMTQAMKLVNPCLSTRNIKAWVKKNNTLSNQCMRKSGWIYTDSDEYCNYYRNPSGMG